MSVMRRSGRVMPSFAALAVLLAGMSACAGSGGSSDVIAHVGEIPIAKDTVERWSTIEAASAGRRADRPIRTRQALGVLISANQLLNEAAAMHLDASMQETKGRLQELEWDRARGLKFEPASKFAPFAKKLASAGKSRPEQLLLLRLDLTAGKVERRLYSEAEHGLTRAKVEAYYASHKGRYVLPEKRQLEVIGSYQRPVIMKAKREVEGGANFIEVAKRVSIDQEAPNGLELPIVRGEEEPAYDRVVFAAKPGHLYGPYEQAFYFIFKVLKITPPRQLSLTQSEGAVRRDVIEDAQRQILGDFYRNLEQHWRPRTNCIRGYVVPGCREYASAAGTRRQ